jgi:hypothetical protein
MEVKKMVMRTMVSQQDDQIDGDKCQQGYRRKRKTDMDIVLCKVDMFQHPIQQIQRHEAQ